MDADEQQWQELAEHQYDQLDWEKSVSVYRAINAVQAELANSGIAKDSTNTQQNYKFRGVDQIYNALAPLLAKHGLCILPRVVSREVVERQSAKGGALFYVTVGVEFDFVASEDASHHTVVTYGEAMDSGDKATNKAMSAAYKYACMQAFSIPTEGDNDADATTHEEVKPIDRTKVMKYSTSIADHLVHDRELGALQDWEEVCAVGEDFASLVWHGLTTPQRDAIRRLRSTKGSAVAA